MHRLLNKRLLLVSLFALLLWACQQEPKVEKPSKPLTINGHTMVFYYPDSLIIDSLKSVLGDRYFAILDSLTNKNSQLRGLSATHNLSMISTENFLLSFEVKPGLKVLMDTRKLTDFAGVIICKPGTYPMVLDSKDFVTQTISYFGGDDTRLGQLKPPVKPQPAKPMPYKVIGIDTSQLLPTDSTLSLRRQSDTISWMKRLFSKFFLLSKPEVNPTPGLTPNALNNMALVSQKKAISVFLENDIFFGTDIWYSNGININIVHPIWQASPISKALIPYKGKSLNFYGLSILQTMFTPQYPTWEGIQYDDRPFGSYLMLGHSKLSTVPDKKLRISSCLYLGVIGKYALGGEIQSYLHGTEKRPVGWKNQIANDIIINYNLEVEKAVLFNGKSDVSFLTGLKAGSLHTNVSVGFRYQWSNSQDYFYDPLPTTKSHDPWNQILKKVKYSFFVTSTLTGVAYDASLQGGLFNKTSPYVISNERLKRFLSTSSVGIGVTYRQFSFDMSGFMLSPEFDPQKRWHKWARLQVNYAF
jgi:hypothetical protein